jgi:hypothetical protein
MSIHNRVHEAYKHQIERDFKESHLPQNINGLLDFLCDDEERGDYRVYHLNDVYEKTTLNQRLNRLWILPCWWVITPFKWIFTGSAGVNTHTKFAKWVAKVTGI